MRKKATKSAGRTSNANAILDRMMGADPAMRRLVEEARSNAAAAEVIYHARTKAELTQKALAELVGTTQSVIARLEDADYEGHSLTMLSRIAAALQSHVEVRIVPNPSDRVFEAVSKG